MSDSEEYLVFLRVYQESSVSSNGVVKISFLGNSDSRKIKIR